MRAETSELDAKALYFVSYDGLVNTAMFPLEGLMTRAGRQYAAWYAADRTATLARRELPPGTGKPSGFRTLWAPTTRTT